MKNYRYVLEYETNVDQNTDKIIKEALYNAWLNTPSKNNFMNYKVYVLGPDRYQTKQMLYLKSLQNESRANGKPIDTYEEIIEYEKTQYISQGKSPQFANLKTAPYIIIFTPRVCTDLNPLQQHLVNIGFQYEQMAKSGPKRDNSVKNARIEIGMFSSNFATEVLSQGLDISHTLCFPGAKEAYPEPEFSFLEEHPILLMTAGKGKIYRRDMMLANNTNTINPDPKPSFETIVNIV